MVCVAKIFISSADFYLFGSVAVDYIHEIVV